MKICDKLRTQAKMCYQVAMILGMVCFLSLVYLIELREKKKEPAAAFSNELPLIVLDMGDFERHYQEQENHIYIDRTNGDRLNGKLVLTLCDINPESEKVGAVDIYIQGKIVDGLKEGIWQYFSSEGKLILVENYKKGVVQ
ncbi:hypothetical protein DMA11_06340 [Marinilabiliaceae bacterium JC017]|nr:hypothetical protein DMA11_06340 [Marinilabiliaceae bacterium JC017]